MKHVIYKILIVYFASVFFFNEKYISFKHNVDEFCLVVR